MSLLLKCSSAIWLILMALLAAYGVYRQPIAIDEILARFDIATTLAVLALIIAGKAAMIYQVGLTLSSAEEDRGTVFSWRAYSIADVSKYLPGGIWGIASRIAIYRAAGMPIKRGTGILLIETALIITFSFLIGLALLLMSHFFALSGVAILAWCLLIAVILFALAFGALRRLGGLRVLAATCVLAFAWTAFGASFALIAAEVPSRYLEAAGLFNVGFAAGQFAVFAPSGIGVREWVIANLSGVGTPSDIRLLVELVLAHRIVWMMADFLVFLPIAFFPIGKRSVTRATDEDIV